ncbi:hypothetical protein [Thalassobacillus hwangdonensis]|uniref:Uncharacterized protein n=1 Tax=Thalassobacillus hwangdonensis TaxID=546108 RepID=A0ABW3L512_9BACI
MSVNLYQINIQTEDLTKVKSYLSRWLLETYQQQPEITERQLTLEDFFEHESPKLFAVRKLQDGWTTVLHDSYEKLEEFNQKLSTYFDGLVVHTLGQSTVDTYYLSVHQRGELTRELYCGEDTLGVEERGNPLPFESELLFDEVGDSIFIDYIYLEEFCEQLGIRHLIEAEAIDGTWEVMRITETTGNPSTLIQRFMNKVFKRT